MNKHIPFNNKHYLQTHGIAMGTKMAVAFSIIFMAKIETNLLKNSHIKPLIWKRFIDDIFTVWTISEAEINNFVDYANSCHPTIKFTSEISHDKVVFLDTEIYKGNRFNERGILDIRTHFKPTETFQYTHFSSCHPFSVKKLFIKGEALRLLRTNSNKESFTTYKKDFKNRLLKRGYPSKVTTKILKSVKFEERDKALTQSKCKKNTKVLPFVTTFNPCIQNLKGILTQYWHLISSNNNLKRIFPDQPIVSYKKDKSLKDFLVRAKIP